MTIAATTTVRDTIERSLANEPQSVVRVSETAKLRPDLQEYVLTDQLARELAKVLERVIEAARAGGTETDRVGIWVSGFFGSGKSHFAKLAGHLLADTPVGNGDTARGLFTQHLQPGRQADARLAELFQEARTSVVRAHLVPFDITARGSEAAERNVGLTFLRAFYDSLGLSSVVAIAERELDLQAAGKYQQFKDLFEQQSGHSWDEEKHLTLSSALISECLAEVQPERYSTADLAHQSLNLAMDEAERHLTIDGVVDRLLRWLDGQQKKAGHAPQRLVFVADEVGAWAGRDLNRIEQLRSFVELLGERGRGRIWLLATSQEKLSDVVQNAPVASAQTMNVLLQRLEARFRTNVHLESSEVGNVIEERVLRKRPTAHAALVQTWHTYEQQLRDVAESPGLELGANYPRADQDPFVKDYPFLPYQLQAAADIFGGMRGVKVSSGARSMIKIVFDATRALADRPLGAVVGWDQLFDSANRDNEFQDEQYLGSQGLTYLNSADVHVTGTPIAQPSRLLKVLWLVQQSSRIPRTPRNLARLLVDDLGADLLRLEQDVAATLAGLEQRSFVRQETATGQWRFLTQDEVTVEKIVRRIAEDLKQKELRDEVQKLHAERVERLFNGTLTLGKSGTPFKYAVTLNGVPLKNDSAPVKLRVDLAASAAEKHAIAEESASCLDAPDVRWVVDHSGKLEERVRRALAIERLENDEEYRRVATERTRGEAVKLRGEAEELRRNAGMDVERALETGTLHWAGNTVALVPAANGKGAAASGARPKVEEALKDRIAAHYHRFGDGDRVFNPANVEKLFTVPAGDRASLDAGLGLFSADGHVHGNHVLVEAVAGYLRASTKTSGQDVADAFGAAPYGWPPDLLRYVGAAMFVDGKVSALERSGKRSDDPKAPGARALFGTAAFKSARLEVEEDSLTPAEATEARALLVDLGHPPADSGEVALREATLQLATGLSKRLAILDKARGVDLPLPASYDGIATTLEAISASATRVKVIRTLLAHSQELREAAAALKRLEDFDAGHGFAQYRRSQLLLAAARQAGLADDPAHGATVQKARDEIEALKQQTRVLDEWTGAYKSYRQDVLDAFKAVYVPLREELHRRSTEAAHAITDGMPEFGELPFGDRTAIRVDFLGEGRPLFPVPLPELRDEQQLLAAHAEYSIAHLRSALAALDAQVSLAREQVLQLHAAEQQRKGVAAKTATWRPADAFKGQRFTTEAEIDTALDAEKERLKALVREGKTVQVV